MRTIFSLLALITSIGLLIYVVTKVVGISTMYLLMLIGALTGAFLGGWALSSTPLTEWISNLNTSISEFIENARREYEAGKASINNTPSANNPASASTIP